MFFSTGYSYPKAPASVNDSLTSPEPLDINSQPSRRLQTRQQTESKPNVLILADQDTSKWTSIQIDAVNILIQGFLEKGFPIYVWNEGLKYILEETNKRKLSDPKNTSFFNSVEVIGVERDSYLNLGELTVLKLDGCSEVDLIPWILMTPKLRVLKIKQPYFNETNFGAFREQLNFEYKNGANILGELEELELSDANITLSSLQNLLWCAPKLSVLRLTDCQLLFSDTDKRLHLNLEKLVSLTLTGLYFKQGDLERIFINAPELSRLFFRQCRGLADELGSPNLYLSKLREFDFSGTRFSDKNLQLFLKNSPLFPPCLQKQHALLNALKTQCSSHAVMKQSSATENKQPQSPPPLIQNQSTRTPEPKSNTVKFKFRGENKTKNQRMIIEKLSQYLTLMNIHIALIPTLQSGICGALSLWFIEMRVDDFMQRINAIEQWDGKEKPSDNSPLHGIFQSIIGHVKDGRLGLTLNEPKYIGDNLDEFIADLSSWCVVTNPWHAIAIQYAVRDDEWWVYDPNYRDGAKNIKKDALSSVIRQSLGPLVSVNLHDLKSLADVCWNWWFNIQPPYFFNTIKDANRFIMEGGVFVLVKCSESDIKRMLVTLSACSCYSVEALNGLLLRCCDDFPAWILGISIPMTAPFTMKLLDQFIQFNPKTYLKKLQRSADALSPEKRQLILDEIGKSEDMMSKHKSMFDMVCEAVRVPAPDLIYQQSLKR